MMLRNYPAIFMNYNNQFLANFKMPQSLHFLMNMMSMYVKFSEKLTVLTP